MERAFVDTSGWVALFVANDKNYTKAASIFESLKDSRSLLYTSDYVIDETLTTILARGGHRQSVVAGEALFSSKIIKIVHLSADLFRKTWELYRKYEDKEFSFTDVSSFLIIKDLHIRKAFTFDRHFAQAGIDTIEL